MRFSCKHRMAVTFGFGPGSPGDQSQVAPCLAGFLAGYRDLTREAYALDLRQCASWCRGR